MADTRQMLFDRLDRLTAALEGGALGGGAGGGSPFRTLAGSLHALPEPYRVLPPDGADASKGFLRPKPGGPAAAAPRKEPGRPADGAAGLVRSLSLLASVAGSAALALAGLKNAAGAPAGFPAGRKKTPNLTYDDDPGPSGPEPKGFLGRVGDRLARFALGKKASERAEDARDREAATGEKAGDRRSGGLVGAGEAVVAAASGLAGAFDRLTSRVTPFVEAFAPSAVLVFRESLRDLSAVVGSALTPVLSGATSVVREFSSALLPVMQRLQPVVAQVSGTLVEVAKVLSGAFASALHALAPVAQFLADALSALAPAVEAAAALFSGLTRAFSTLVGWVLGTDLTGATKALRSAMESLAGAVLKAAANLLMLVSPDLGRSFVGGARAALTGEGMEKGAAAGMAAMRDVRFANFADFGRQVATSSAGAFGGASEQKTSEEWLKKIADDLQEIAGMGRQDVWEKLRNAVTDGVRAAAGRAAYGAAEAVKDSAIGWAVSNPGAVAREIFGFGSLYK